MAHGRMFTYPVTGDQQVQLNALYVDAILLVDQGNGMWSVNVNVGGAGYASSAMSEVNAQALFDLWSQRAEDAR